MFALLPENPEYSIPAAEDDTIALPVYVLATRGVNMACLLTCILLEKMLKNKLVLLNASGKLAWAFMF
jgi:hypothetical protein